MFNNLSTESSMYFNDLFYKQVVCPRQRAPKYPPRSPISLLKSSVFATVSGCLWLPVYDVEIPLCFKTYRFWLLGHEWSRA